MNEHKVGMFRPGYKLTPALDAVYRAILRLCDIITATALAIEVVLINRYALFYAEVLLLFIENVTIRRAIFVFNSVIMLVFFATVFWTGIDYVTITWTFVLDYSETPKYIFYGSMPVWGGLMFMVILKSLVCMENPDVTEIDAEN